MNPHTDTVPTAAEVPAALSRAMMEPGYVIRVGPPAACLTCGTVTELRFGHCFGCVSKTPGFVDHRPAGRAFLERLEGEGDARP